MKFFVGGGRPGHVKEEYMIKDGEGYIMSTRDYIVNNPDLFRYVGHARINSTVFHTYEFIPNP